VIGAVGHLSPTAIFAPPSFLSHSFLFFSTDLHQARLDKLVAEYEDLWQHTQAQDGLLKGSAERLGELAAR
jgi:hypothetical protein